MRTRIVDGGSTFPCLRAPPSFHRMFDRHAVHLKHMEGVVMLYGLGDGGAMLYNLCRKFAVSLVVVIEPDEGVVRLTHRMAGRWRGSDKVRMVVADASTVTRAKISRSFGQIDQISYLYADIPPADGDPPLDVLELQQKMCARAVGWRGQEVSFVKWCEGQEIGRPDVDLDTFDRWCLDIDMAVHERSTAYIDHCYAVAGRT